MDLREIFEKLKIEIFGDDLVITSLDDALEIHEKFVRLRFELMSRYGFEIMAHYRGEQFLGWDIVSGVFRPPSSISDPLDAKKKEKKAIYLFKEKITKELGASSLRDKLSDGKYTEEWDLLFQSQHAGVKTTLIDFTAHIRSALFFATEKSSNQEI